MKRSKERKKRVISFNVGLYLFNFYVSTRNVNKRQKLSKCLPYTPPFEKKNFLQILIMNNQSINQ